MTAIPCLCRDCGVDCTTHHFFAPGNTTEQICPLCRIKQLEKLINTMIECRSCCGTGITDSYMAGGGAVACSECAGTGFHGALSAYQRGWIAGVRWEADQRRIDDELHSSYGRSGRERVELAEASPPQDPFPEKAWLDK